MCRGGGGDDNEEREAGRFGFSFCLRYTSRLGGVVVVVVEFGLVACCVHARRPFGSEAAHGGVSVCCLRP